MPRPRIISICCERLCASLRQRSRLSPVPGRTPFPLNTPKARPHRARGPRSVHRPRGDPYYLVFTMWPFATARRKGWTSPTMAFAGDRAVFIAGPEDLEVRGWLVKSSDLPEDCPYKHRFWAPEIHRIGGQFYLVFTADNWLKHEFNPAGTWGTRATPLLASRSRSPGPTNTSPGSGARPAILRSLAVVTGGPTPDSALRHRHAGDRLFRFAARARSDAGAPRRIVIADNSDIGIAAEAGLSGRAVGGEIIGRSISSMLRFIATRTFSLGLAIGQALRRRHPAGAMEERLSWQGLQGRPPRRLPRPRRTPLVLVSR